MPSLGVRLTDSLPIGRLILVRRPAETLRSRGNGTSPQFATTGRRPAAGPRRPAPARNDHHKSSPLPLPPLV
jgi:hypothetical protein